MGLYPTKRAHSPGPATRKQSCKSNSPVPAALTTSILPTTRARTGEAAKPLRPPVSFGLRFETALHQLGSADAFGPRGEGRYGSAQPKLLDIAEQLRIGIQRREPLEQVCCYGWIAQNICWKGLDGPVSVQQPRHANSPDAFDSRITIGSIAYKRKKVRDQYRFDTELFPDVLGVMDLLGPPVDPKPPVAANALGQTRDVNGTAVMSARCRRLSPITAQ